MNKLEPYVKIVQLLVKVMSPYPTCNSVFYMTSVLHSDLFAKRSQQRARGFSKPAYHPTCAHLFLCIIWKGVLPKFLGNVELIW